MNSRYQQPRRQAERLAELVSREGSHFRAVVLGKRGEGKSDLLRQVHAQLFARAEGPVPFLYSFGDSIGDASGDKREEAAQARHCFASFCQQVRAFLMRQEELLGEPVALLERELERPGLPLSLTELAQTFLELPAEYQMAFAASLPAQFSHLERRPVCWLLDEVQELGRQSPIFAALASPGFSWLLGGRQPFLRRLAGEAAFPVTPLEPFSFEDALAQADRQCRTAEVPFSPEAWEAWLEVTGTSPWLIGSLVDAAAIHGHALNTLEELGRTYIQELAAGALGNWLAARFERALPDRRDRVTVARFLEGLAKTGLPSPTPSFPQRVWDGLVAEEWAVDTPLGPQPQLEPVQWDWLWLVTASQGAPSQRAQARALQALLLRVEQKRERRRATDLSISIRQRLLELPQRGFPMDLEWSGGPVQPPEICAVSSEQSGNIELFWCYGFHGNRRDTPETACVLLIALCGEQPVPGEAEVWRRRLENEERLLPAGASGQPASSRRELWWVLPAGSSMAGAASERCFPLETFTRWLGAGAAAENRY
ncbi:MAG: hypothetical protein A3H28_13080 [Acidobacteria bacterium RIFCSPLOWO2_02_FULL_61_28]|nr:MAG: hypothetical protein A3H28_13080 [Acidobacteria bacterium RIFCSPLOWO2_02_FULL_61_28]